MPTPDSIAVEQAIDWMVKLRFNQSDEATHLAFEQWLQVRPANVQAWQRVAGLSDDFSTLPADITRATLSATRRRISRRQSLKLLGLCVAAGSLGWAGSEQQTVSSLLADHRSGTGERPAIQLADGTHVRLNSNSAFNVQFNAERRLIDIRQGDLLIETGADSDFAAPRPLWIRTRHGDLLAESRRFVIREEAGHTRLAVGQGQISTTARNTVARQDEQAELRGGRLTIARDNALDIWSWTDGVISAHEMRLADFISELSRHRSGLLRCTEEIAELRVSGTYQLADTDQVLELLSRVLPVRLEYRSRYWVTVTAST